MGQHSNIHARICDLRREIVEISATTRVRHHSGAEKVKRDKSIRRLRDIQNELFALIAKSRAMDALVRKDQRK